MSNYRRNYSKNITDNNLYLKSKIYDPHYLNHKNTSNNNYLNKPITKIQFKTKPSKESISPFKFNHYNLENQKPRQKQPYIRTKFEQMKNRYDFSNKLQTTYRMKRSPLKQANINYPHSNSIKRFSQTKHKNRNSIQQTILDEKIQYLQKRTQQYDFMNVRRKDSNKYVYKQQKNTSLIKQNLQNRNKHYNIQEFDKHVEKVQLKDGEVEKSNQNAIKLQQQRIESIDRINKKIQKIIKSINPKQNLNNQNQQNKSTQLKFTLYNHRNLSVDHIPLKQANRINQQKNQNKQSFLKHRGYSVNKIYNKTLKLQSNNKFTDVNRSQSFLNRMDVDGEIKKINDRIIKSQQQKLKLNIKFQKYQQYSSKKSQKSFKSPKKQSINQDQFYDSRKNSRNNGFFKIQVSNQVPIKTSPHFEKSKISQSDLKQTQRLIQHLKHQVKLDQNLRNKKLIYSMLGQSNWKKLKQKLQNQTKKEISQKTVQKYFQITLQEHDPFFKFTGQSTNQIQLVEIYIKAEDYYSNHIKNKFNKQLLLKQKFKQDHLDLQRKGYLTIQDLVRYLNIQTGTFYRNRDLILILKRLTKQNRLTFSQLLQALC